LRREGDDSLLSSAVEGRGHRRMWMRWWLGVAGLAYLLASVALFRGVLEDPVHRAPQGGAGDNAQMTWFLRWTAWAVTHGVDPFVSHLMNAPVGLNLMWNTAMLPLGLVMTPVTLAMGPLVSLNLLYVLGAPLTALGGAWWLSRHVRPLAAAIGGAALGYCPFMATHMGGHLNFTFLALVPLMLRWSEDLLWRAPGRERSVVLLGVSAAVQALLSEEVLLMLAIGSALAVVLCVLAGGAEAGPLLRRSLPGIAAAAGLAVLLLAVPLTVQLLGPDRVRGVNPYRYYARPADFAVPSDRLLLGSAAHSRALDARSSSPFEDSVYLGLPLLLVLGCCLVVWRRRSEVTTALGVIGATLLLTTGKGAGRGWAGWQHPVALLLSPPVLSSMVATRFALVADIALAWLLAQVCQQVVVTSRAGRPRPFQAAALAVGLILVALSWIPAPPRAQRPVGVPSFFWTSQSQRIAPGSLVLLLPAPPGGDNRALLYQAIAGLQFRMLDSYAISHDASGRSSSYGTTDPITALMADSSVTASACSRARRQLYALGVQHVLVTPTDDVRGRLSTLTRKVLGAPTRVSGGVQLWDLTPPSAPS
jgi:hypothetical protein